MSRRGRDLRRKSSKFPGPLVGISLVSKCPTAHELSSHPIHQSNWPNPERYCPVRLGLLMRLTDETSFLNTK